ncbi:Gamma-soluble NSF attachment protein [Zancudomyces culisetae]|uniref:Gamma-soluble NSF attachment protein n=1 Tax=Zancudomyces culisetae TaxID=1213189 RepID=A0A1R1PJ03_ZANCU|nr:Gamma-soluble NSF attachment protein [Zancudomyces culisetae]|eukprot:OMH80964.1 Gamma-soluble NSF attachment protein [Zancudomyces culisetae]
MPERSAELMEKAAKLSESIDVERAYQLYLNVISIYETENKNRFALQTFKNATSFLAEKKRYTEAIQLLHRLASLCSKINNHVEVGRCFLATIILLLAFGDEVEATKQFDVFAAEDPLFTRSDEYNASHQLLEAYKSYDQNLLNSAIKNRSLNDLHSSFRRVAYSLLVPGANSATSANPVSVTPGTTGPATAISGSPGGMDHHPDSSHATAHVPNLNIDNDDDLL